MYCCICLIDKKREEAQTIVDGKAICFKHLRDYTNDLEDTDLENLRR